MSVVYINALYHCVSRLQVIVVFLLRRQNSYTTLWVSDPSQTFALEPRSISQELCRSALHISLSSTAISGIGNDGMATVTLTLLTSNTCIGQHLGKHRFRHVRRCRRPRRSPVGCRAINSDDARPVFLSPTKHLQWSPDGAVAAHAGPEHGLRGSRVERRGVNSTGWGRRGSVERRAVRNGTVRQWLVLMEKYD